MKAKSKKFCISTHFISFALAFCFNYKRAQTRCKGNPKHHWHTRASNFASFHIAQPANYNSLIYFPPQGRKKRSKAGIAVNHREKTEHFFFGSDSQSYLTKRESRELCVWSKEILPLEIYVEYLWGRRIAYKPQTKNSFNKRAKPMNKLRIARAFNEPRLRLGTQNARKTKIFFSWHDHFNVTPGSRWMHL